MGLAGWFTPTKARIQASGEMTSTMVKDALIQKMRLIITKAPGSTEGKTAKERITNILRVATMANSRTVSSMGVAIFTLKMETGTKGFTVVTCSMERAYSTTWREDDTRACGKMESGTAQAKCTAVMAT